VIIDLADAADHPGTGSKARGLAQLIAWGCRVPKGFVLRNGYDLPPTTVKNRTHCWAVRSSGTVEDLPGYSFAGQYATYLNVATADVPARVRDCLASLQSEQVQAYLSDHGLEAHPDGMAVIVQEMAPADVSGVAFSLNPSTGHDTEVVIEAAPGLGDALVAGRVNPDRYTYDWYAGADTTPDPAPTLTAQQRQTIVDEVVRVAALAGYPVDIEFAMVGDELWLLQCRPITRVRYTGIPDQWSTADFKDGGVSAGVCTPFMWSLYSYIWERTLRRFLLDSKILERRDLRQLGDMFYGRPYWNMSVVKEAMSRVPGFRERQFDSEFGVRITYAGDGRTTPVSPRSLARIARIALAQRRIVADHKAGLEARRDELVARNQHLLERVAATAEGSIAPLWRRIVKDDYLASEGTYFWQIFINTIHQSMNKDTLLKALRHVHSDEERAHAGYFTLISGLDRVSHLLPFYDTWTLTRRLRGRPESVTYWQRSVDQIRADLRAGHTEHGLGEVAAMVERYSYHSTKELDVTYPDFDEDPGAVVAMVASTMSLDDGFGPDADRARLGEAYEAELAGLRQALSPRRFARVQRLVADTRQMLWWREELRDVSTRYYHLIRKATQALADELVTAGSLDAPDDIWFIPMGQVDAFLSRRLDDLRPIVARNRTYYQSYRHYLSENEIGHVFDASTAAKPAAATDTLTGLGASSGAVTGTARVIAGLDEIGRVQPGDILITRFTDTGWTPAFARLSGIVTEYGGILCHAAIVSREYGIPAVVAATGACTQILDGATIHVDGASGVVSLLQEDA